MIFYRSTCARARLYSIKDSIKSDVRHCSRFTKPIINYSSDIETLSTEKQQQKSHLNMIIHF